ncbi:MAG: chloride channel protein [Synergistaceae bacterium]|nr:chloride channel protein [Synergistaceae bacterium]
MDTKIVKDELVRDEFWLLSSFFKWSFFSIMAGVIVGTVAAGFLISLDWAIEYISSFSSWRYLLIFPALLFSLYFVRILAPEAAGHGTEKVIDAVHRRAGIIDIKVVPVKLIATIVTIAAGGSAGKEGPCAQIGAGLMYGLSRVFRLDESDRKKLVICGISAGFSAVFGTPITGAVFGVEVLFVGQMFYDVLLPSFISGIVSCFTASYLGAGHLPEYIVDVPLLAPSLIGWSLLAGVFFGTVSVFHIECLHAADRKFKSLKIPEWQKPLLGGAILLAIGALFGSKYLGLGMDTIDEAIRGGSLPIYAFAIKSFAMAVTLSCGGSGGVLTPTLFVGAAAGSLFANLFGLDPSIASALGLAGVLAGSTNTPIASTILAMELFGAPIAPFAGLVSAVSYVVAGHRSLYPSQVILRPKARTFVRRNVDGKTRITSRFAGLSYNRVIRFYLENILSRIIRRK